MSTQISRAGNIDVSTLLSMGFPVEGLPGLISSWTLFGKASGVGTSVGRAFHSIEIAPNTATPASLLTTETAPNTATPMSILARVMRAEVIQSAMSLFKWPDHEPTAVTPANTRASQMTRPLDNTRATLDWPFVVASGHVIGTMGVPATHIDRLERPLSDIMNRVREASRQLDGSLIADIALLSGLSREEIDELGGV